MNEGIQQYGRSYLSFLVQELSVKLLHLGGVHFPYKTIRDFLLGCSVIRNYREVSQHKSTIETCHEFSSGFLDATPSSRTSTGDAVDMVSQVCRHARHCEHDRDRPCCPIPDAKQKALDKRA